MSVTVANAISSIILSSFSAILFIIMFIQRFLIKQKQKINNTLYFIAMAALFSATTRFALTAILLLGDNATDGLRWSLAIFRLLFIILIYLFYIAQLHFTFKNSSYKVSNIIIAMHLINMCVSLIFYGITFTLFEIENNVQIAGNITYAIGRIFLIFGIIHLTFIFNHRLLKLISSKIDPQKITPQKLGKIQLNILEVVINRTVLISIWQFP